MKVTSKAKSDKGEHNLVRRQANDKASEPVRVRSAEGTAAYWRAKLFRNTYRSHNGATVEIPEYYVRMRRDGVTKRVRLRSADKDVAADAALALASRLAREGWSAVTAGSARLPCSPSIDQFCEAFKEATASFEKPIRPVTVKLYVRHLRQICALDNVITLRELTPTSVQRARDAYKAKARKEKRDETAVINSLGIITGNAKACFQSEALAIMARKGWIVENPFKDIQRTTINRPVTALPREVVERIWSELPLLRDGDPKAPAPDIARYKASYSKKHGGRVARWLPADFRQPHPASYCAVLLSLGLGLRANECDKARWSWLQFDAKGECFLKIAEESDFKPKGGTLRLLRVPADLYAELVKARTDMSSPYIMGGQPRETVKKDGTANENVEYRCREAIRIANEWLAERGVEAGNVHGKKLHGLRKQFGSEVATRFGLFAAQKLLGHASPITTSQHYSAQTDLPALTHVRIVG